MKKFLLACSLIITLMLGVLISPQSSNAAHWIKTVREKISYLVVTKSLNLKSYIKNSTGAVKIKDNLKVTGNINLADGKTVDGVDVSALETTINNQVDADTTYTAGTGLALDGTVFSSALTAGTGLALDGTVFSSTLTAGTGLALDGTTFSSTLGTTIESTEITNGTISASDLSTGSVTAEKMASNSCVSNQELKYNGTAWVCSNTGDDYKNVINVAKTGGDYSTITAALSSITDNSATNKYVINIAPGIYEEQITMKAYVSLNGAGRDLTSIKGHGGLSMTTDATLITADNSALRNLTIDTAGTGVNATAIYMNGTDPQLENINVTVSGASNECIGMYIAGDSAPFINNVNVTINTVTTGTGIDIENTATPNIFASQVYVLDGTTFNVGIKPNGTGTWSVHDTLVSVDGAMTSSNYGIMTNNGTLKLYNVSVDARGGDMNNIGIFNSSSATLKLYHSNVYGTNKSITNYGTVSLGASEISSAVNNVDAGTSTCAQVYSSNFAEAQTNCTFL